MARQLKVRYTATFEATITVEDDESVQDAVDDINIPEDNVSKYVEQTFDIDSVKDAATGVNIDPALEDNPVMDEDEEDEDHQ